MGPGVAAPACPMWPGQAAPLCAPEVSAPGPLPRGSLPWPCCVRVPSATPSPFPARTLTAIQRVFLAPCSHRCGPASPLDCQCQARPFPSSQAGEQPAGARGPCGVFTSALPPDPAPAVPAPPELPFPQAQLLWTPNSQAGGWGTLGHSCHRPCLDTRPTAAPSHPGCLMGGPSTRQPFTRFVPCGRSRPPAAVRLGEHRPRLEPRSAAGLPCGFGQATPSETRSLLLGAHGRPRGVSDRCQGST